MCWPRFRFISRTDVKIGNPEQPGEVSSQIKQNHGSTKNNFFLPDQKIKHCVLLEEEIHLWPVSTKSFNTTKVDFYCIIS